MNAIVPQVLAALAAMLPFSAVRVATTESARARIPIPDPAEGRSAARSRTATRLLGRLGRTRPGSWLRGPRPSAALERSGWPIDCCPQSLTRVEIFWKGSREAFSDHK